LRTNTLQCSLSDSHMIDDDDDDDDDVCCMISKFSKDTTY